MKKSLIMVLALSTVSQALEPAIFTFEPDSSGYKLEWDGVTSVTSFIQYSTTLQKEDWLYFPVIKSGVGSYSYGFSTTEDKLFVRIVSTDIPVANLTEAENADFDSDGIPNIFELNTLATDPLDFDSSGGDTDSDGLKDGWEIYFFGDLNTADPSAILGSDGLTNKEKSELGLDPNKNYTAPTTTEKSSYTYDLVGRLTQVSNTLASATYNLDEEGNILTAQ